MAFVYDIIWWILNLLSVGAMLYILLKIVRTDLNFIHDAYHEPETRKKSLYGQNSSKGISIETIFGRYLSTIAVFVALAISYIVLQLAAPILDYINSLQQANSLSKVGCVIVFFTAGFYYAKVIINRLIKIGEKGDDITYMARATVALYISFGLCAMVLNFASQLQGKFVILRGINLAFFAGMGIFLIFGKLPSFKLLSKNGSDYGGE